MTQEDKELLLRDLCCRLPYGVKYLLKSKNIVRSLTQMVYEPSIDKWFIDGVYDTDEAKPYLRPMSMTEEESETLWNIWENDAASEAASKMTDFLNKKHLDHHHLIEKGLALEAPEGMYNEKEK